MYTFLYGTAAVLQFGSTFFYVTLYQYRIVLYSSLILESKIRLF